MALRRFIVFTVFLLMLAAAPVWASTATIPDLPRVDDSVKIDGILDEDAWRQALQIQVNTETSPGENIPAKVKTVAIAQLSFKGSSLYSCALAVIARARLSNVIPGKSVFIIISSCFQLNRENFSERFGIRPVSC